MNGIETPINDLDIRIMNPTTGTARTPQVGALAVPGAANLALAGGGAGGRQAYVYGDRRRLYAPCNIPQHLKDKRFVVTGWIARAGAGARENIKWVMAYLGPAPGGQGMHMFEHTPDY